MAAVNNATLMLMRNDPAVVSKWAGDHIKDVDRFELILQGLRDGECNDVGLTQASDIVSGQRRVIQGRVHVFAVAYAANGTGFNVGCTVSHQYLRLALRKKSCQVVDDDGAVVTWHDKEEGLPEGVWDKGLSIVLAVPTKSAAKKA